MGLPEIMFHGQRGDSDLLLRRNSDFMPSGDKLNAQFM